MNLNDVIIKFTGTSSDRAKLEEVVRANGDVFFPIIGANRDLPPGTLAPTDVVQLALITVSTGKMALFYSSKDDSRLGQKFGGVPIQKALEIVTQMKGADGMLIQSDASEWIVVDKDDVAKLLALSHIDDRQLNDFVAECGHSSTCELGKLKFLPGNIKLYFPITSVAETAQLTGSAQRTNLTETKLRTAKCQLGVVALFFTTSKDDRLGIRFGAIGFREALKMTMNLDGVNGMLIQSDKSAWIALDKSQISEILSD